MMDGQKYWLFPGGAGHLPEVQRQSFYETLKLNPGVSDIY